MTELEQKLEYFKNEDCCSLCVEGKEIQGRQMNVTKPHKQKALGCVFIKKWKFADILEIKNKRKLQKENVSHA